MDNREERRLMKKKREIELKAMEAYCCDKGLGMAEFMDHLSKDDRDYWKELYKQIHGEDF